MNLVKYLFVGFLVVFFVGCDEHGISPAATKICGTVKFIGEYPENATLAYIVLGYSRPPNDELNPNYMASYIEIPIDKKPEYFDYELFVEPDTSYKWLVVAFLGNLDSLGTHNIVGEYKDPLNPTQTGVIKVAKNECFFVDTIVVNFEGVHIPIVADAKHNRREERAER